MLSRVQYILSIILVVIRAYCLGFLLSQITYHVAIAAEPVTAQNDLINLRFNQAPIAIILQALADHQQINLVVNGNVQGEYTLNLVQISWQQALEIILQLGGLESELRNNILYIAPALSEELRQQQRRERELRSLANQPLHTLSYQVKHSDAVIFARRIQDGTLSLSERGKVWVDEPSNRIFIRDISSVIRNVKPVLAELDKPIRQVNITAYIVTISQEGLRELGMRWGERQTTAELDRSPLFSVDLGLKQPALQASFRLAKLNGRILDLELSALEAENQVEIMASPRLVTLDRQMASIKQGAEIPYEVSSGSNGATSIEFKDAVLGLEITPLVMNSGQIELDLLISQNTPGKALKRSNGGEILTIDTQQIKTKVVVTHGETVVLGGVFQYHNATGYRGVPLLSRLPLLGGLFRQNTEKSSKRELVVFITPALTT